MRAWFGIFIASCGLCFQLRVLYPWHIELSNDFKELREILKKMEENDKELQELNKSQP